ncbi:MAG: S-layer homology domain-containing protein [Oscillospiraceae bacterium]|nr:S-layer homology domain-containing protein [Oscillospiraceae bacterium]
MRNLKKILALVLALMMTLSLMATASAKDFTDADEIQYKEAVEVMYGLGVLNGYPDGSFGAKDPVARAAAAKIVAYIMEGGFDKVVDKASVLPELTFTDVPTSASWSWAVASIKYLVDAGMIKGYDATTFGTNDPVVAAAFGKLVLLAAGIGTADDYVTDATQTFETKVMVALKDNGLLDGVKETIKAKTVLTREQACQIAWNAMNHGTTVYTVKFSTNAADNAANLLCANETFASKADAVRFALSVKSTGNLVANAGATAGNFQIDPVKTGTLYADKFGGKVVSGIVSANGANTQGQKYTTINGVKYAVETGLDVIGHKVTVHYKDADAEPSTGYEVYGIKDITTIVGIAATMTAQQVKDTFAAVKVTSDLALNSVPAIADGVVGSNANAAITLGTTAGAACAGYYLVADGAVIGVLGTDTQNKVLMKVTAYTAPTKDVDGTIDISGLKADGTFGTAATITLEKLSNTTAVRKVALYEGVKANDYVYVTKAGTAQTVVEKANSTVATVTARNTTVGVTTISLDGVAVKYAAVGGIGLTAPTGATLGTKYNVVFNAAGTVAGVYTYTPDQVSVADTYAQVLEVAYVEGVPASLSNGNVATPAKVVVKVLLVDGTTATYTYTSAADPVKTNSTDLKAEMNYGGSAAGTIAPWDVIKFAVEGNALTEVKKYTEAAAMSTAAITDATAMVDTGKFMNANTVLVYQAVISNPGQPDDGLPKTSVAAKSVTGYAAAKAAVAANVVFVTDAEGTILVAFVKGAYPDAPVTATNIAYIPYTVTGSTDAFYDAAAKANRYNYVVFVDGVATTLVSDANDKTGTAGFVTYTLTNGLLSANLNSTITGYTGLDGTVSFLDGDTIVVGTTQKTLSKDVKIVTDNFTNNYAIGGTVTAGGTLAVGQTVKTLFNADGEIVYVAIIAPAAA